MSAFGNSRLTAERLARVDRGNVVAVSRTSDLGVGSGPHPNRHLASYAGILQADAYGGYNDLYKGDRRPVPIIEAACRSHGRRKFFVLADVAKTAAARSHKRQAAWSPLAHEAVRRIELIFDAERGINADRRLELRQTTL
jgi:transposase